MSAKKSCISIWLLAVFLPVAAVAAELEGNEYDAALRAKPDWERGRALYDTCSACHGPEGRGTRDGAIPVIAAQHFRVVVWALTAYRLAQRWDPRMEHFADPDHLPDAQSIADVAFYVSTLRPIAEPGVGDGELVAHGEQLYSRFCVSCHGRRAEGHGQSLYPKLAGQHYEYLLRQLHDFMEERRPNVPQDHLRLMEGFEKADLTGVADYLSRLGKQ